MKSGIYSIRSKTTGQLYIGGSIQIEKRWIRHLRDLKNNKHHSFKLQDIYNQSGDSDLEFKILEECSECVIKSLEQKYLDESGIKNLLNTSKFATFGDVISYHPKRKEIINKIKESCIITYSKMTKLEKSLKYGMRLEKNPNWKGGKIKEKTTCICGFKKDYYAKLCTDCCDKSGNNNPFYGKSHTEESKDKISKSRIGIIPSNARKVIINNVIYNSATEASKSLKCTPSTILNRINKNKDGYCFHTQV